MCTQWNSDHTLAYIVQLYLQITYFMPHSRTSCCHRKLSIVWMDFCNCWVNCWFCSVFTRRKGSPRFTTHAYAVVVYHCTNPTFYEEVSQSLFVRFRYTFSTRPLSRKLEECSILFLLSLTSFPRGIVGAVVRVFATYRCVFKFRLLEPKSNLLVPFSASRLGSPVTPHLKKKKPKEKEWLCELVPLK